MIFEDIFQNKLFTEALTEVFRWSQRTKRAGPAAGVSPRLTAELAAAGKEQVAPGWSSTQEYVLGTHWDLTDN